MGIIMEDKIVHLWLREIKESPKEEKEEYRTSEVSLDLLKLLNNLRNKTLKEFYLDELDLPNPSIEEWLKVLQNNYPKRRDIEVRNLLNEFRQHLYTLSKIEGKVLLLLQTPTTIIIAHSKKEKNLALEENSFKTIESFLGKHNVLRFILFELNTKNKLSVRIYEYNRKLTKGISEFLGILPEDVGWDVYGDITFHIKLGNTIFKLEKEPEEIGEMFKTGQILLEENKIILEDTEFIIEKIQVRNKVFSNVKDFYDYFIRVETSLEPYVKVLKIIQDENKNTNLGYHFGWIRYIEDNKALYKIENEKVSIVKKKTHHLFNPVFTRRKYPLIKPKTEYLSMIFNSIFFNQNFSICQIEDEFISKPIVVGSLEIYNKPIFNNNSSLNLLNELILKSQDAGEKIKSILQFIVCLILEKFIFKNTNLSYLFSDINESFIKPKINSIFGKGSDIFGVEDQIIEFKGANFYLKEGKPKRFADKLQQTIKKYIEKTKIKILLIGIDDISHKIEPLYNIKDETITEIKKWVKVNCSLFDILRISINHNNSLLLVVALK